MSEPQHTQASRIAARSRMVYLPALVLILGGGGYFAGRALRTPVPDRLAVLGSPEVNVEHDDRTKPVIHTFELYNPTAHPIHVKEVRAGCACMKCDLQDTTLAPGQTVPAKIQINSFRTFRYEFQEDAVVDSDYGKIKLSIRGTLSPANAVAVRPNVLHLRSAIPFPLQRTVAIRVPIKYTSEPFTVDEAPWQDWPSARAQLIESAPSEYYREFSLVLQLPDRPSSIAVRKLQVRGGDVSIDIPVEVEQP